MFEGRGVGVAIFYTGCKKAATWCDEWMNNEQAIKVTVLFHGLAF